MSWLKREKIMLCQPLDDNNLERIFKDSKQGVIVQPKLDGVRAWVDYTETGQPLLISSTGSIIDSVPHINLALKNMANVIGEERAFDGELYVKGWSFERINSVVSRTANLHEDFSEIEYHIFDIKSRQSQIERIVDIHEHLNDWKNRANNEDYCTFHKILRAVPHSMCMTIKSVHNSYNTWVSDGYEGIVVRHMIAPYKEGRPWYILKFKPKREDLYNFEYFEEAVSQTGEALGRVGAVVCSDDEGNMFRVGTGIGLTHADLEKLWNDKDFYTKDHKVLVAYQNLTSAGGVPRFGKFIEITL